MIKIAILTISDAGSKGQRADGSGDAIAAWAQAAGHSIAAARRRRGRDHRDRGAAGGLGRW